MQTHEIVLDPEQAADIAKFESMLAAYLDGSLAEDAFRVFRLTNGIYGQRQGGHNQMVRVRIPYGKVSPCLLYTSPSPRDKRQSRMPSSA